MLRLAVFAFSLTANAICVLIRSTEEVWDGHQQRSQAGQQGTTPDEPRPVDSAPEEAHKDDEDRVAHLQRQTSVAKAQTSATDRNWRCNICIQGFVVHIVKTRRYTRTHKSTGDNISAEE